MAAREILGAETTRFEQGDGQRVAHRELRGGRCGRRQIQRAGFLGHTRVQMHIGMGGQRRFRVPGHRDQLGALALERRHNRQQLFRRARIRQADEDIVGGDHAEVAMAGFGRMHEEGRGAGRGQGGGDLAGDMSGLTHARDHHAAAAGENQCDGIAEVLRLAVARQAFGHGAQAFAFDGEHIEGRRDGVTRRFGLSRGGGAG